MRNKPDIDEIDIDDLYNNLRVYEDEMKRSSSSTSTSQNLAFLSSKNTSSTNEVSTASGDFRVSTAGGISQVSSTSCAHDVACSFFAQPTTSPQLENEDFQQINEDDLEELDLRWQVAMLTVRIWKESREKAIQRSCVQDPCSVDSGCSSHMTGNKAYLSDYEDYNGGFVVFESDPKGDFHEIIDFLTRISIHYALTYITAKVAGKPVNISEASIRSDLLFDDADGIDSLHNQAIFNAIQLIGNFPKLILWYDGHLDSKEEVIVMYPRFIPVFLTNQLKNVSVPLDHFPINALTTNVFSFMVKKDKSFFGNVTPLFPSMLAQPTEDEDQHETQLDPSPRPSPTIPIPDSIPECSGGNHGECLHKEKIGQKEIIEEKVDAKGVYAYMQKGVITEDQVSTVKPDEEVEVSTMDKADEVSAEPKDGTSYESTALTIVFRDDETIAEFLVSMSQNKAKQKGVEIKDAEDSDRPRATSTRSVLTLKPLPKIDPKDKGKKVLEEEAESDAELEGVDEAERKFDQLAKDEEIARKVQDSKEVLFSIKEKRLKKRVANETPREEDTAKVPAEQEVTEQGTCHTPRRGLDGTRVRRRDLIDHLKYKA
ncbi:hypothetical protein Tco_0661185 [Tanacetum coccineum]